MAETDGAKRVGLVAHDRCKAEMVDWVRTHRAALARHRLVGTGTTGGAIREATGLEVERLLSGPQGGDAQLGARIAEGRLDVLIFFIDPLSAMPHDVDVKALLRLAILHDVAFACNRATADAFLQGPLLSARD
ncbi:methylglyoxal synthase [Tistlia consotensis]|uniref:Methylglyoxal synthase n=1 Tax=Tistlia consotensis USBA 355 TaxID=560819 RepID=A0A1Y6CWG9_9PROT|nr:methylglyoxal synthase [Tistlia consotensis]SMF83568.1 methylglyoxal synthase [Tistlia consotensis USBA 355]SNS33506.1 methylglyoxal synthase [Tistlia consotensis]